MKQNLDGTNFSREEIIAETHGLLAHVIDLIKMEYYTSAVEQCQNMHTALTNLIKEDKEIFECRETLVNSLVSEGMILPMRKGGTASSPRRPQQPTIS